MMINQTIVSMLKKSIFTLSLIAVVAFSANAQRIAYVDVTEILESIEEYQDAQKELDAVAATWRQEIAGKYDDIKGKYNQYQAEQVLLSDDARKNKEDEIMKMEQDVRELQKQYFGPEGSLFQKRKQLVQPIQEQVYGAIEDYAKERGFDFIFDKGGAAGIIFSNEEFDKTGDILKKLARG